MCGGSKKPNQIQCISHSVFSKNTVFSQCFSKISLKSLRDKEIGDVKRFKQV